MRSNSSRRPRIRARAVRRFEQDVEGAVELHAGTLEVAHLQLALTRFEALPRGLDEGRDGSGGGGSGAG